MDGSTRPRISQCEEEPHKSAVSSGGGVFAMRIDRCSDTEARPPDSLFKIRGLNASVFHKHNSRDKVEEECMDAQVALKHMYSVFQLTRGQQAMVHVFGYSRRSFTSVWFSEEAMLNRSSRNIGSGGQ